MDGATEASAFAWTTIALEEQDEVLDDVVAWRPDTWPLWTAQAALLIQRFWAPLLVCFGTIGNVFVIIVMGCTPKNRRVATSVYLVAIAVIDILLLSILSLYWLTTEVLRAPIHGGRTCAIFSWLFHSASLTSNVLIVSMTIDRYIAVCHPVKAKVYCTHQRAKLTIGLAAVCCVVYTIPYWMTARLTNHSVCTVMTIKSRAYTIYSWLTFALKSAIPFCILLAFNVAIIRGLRRAKAAVADSKRGVAGREGQLTVLLLMITFTFILLTAPQHATHIYYMYTDQAASIEAYAQFMFASHLSNKLFYTNNAINFLLLTVSGSKFRQDFKNLFCCGRKTQAPAH